MLRTKELALECGFEFDRQQMHHSKLLNKLEETYGRGFVYLRFMGNCYLIDRFHWNDAGFYWGEGELEGAMIELAISTQKNIQSTTGYM